MKKLQAEITQVAAVCAAALEDIQFGRAFGRALMEPGSGLYEQQSKLVAEQIRNERDAQDYKWGIQHHNLLEWMMILLEEVGELAEIVKFMEPKVAAEDPETKFGYHVLDKVREVGDNARNWCESHEWPERQQRVYDAIADSAARPLEDSDVLPMGSGY